MARRVVEAHNGKLFLFSEGEDMGTTIYIEIPVILILNSCDEGYEYSSDDGLDGTHTSDAIFSRNLPTMTSYCYQSERCHRHRCYTTLEDDESFATLTSQESIVSLVSSAKSVPHGIGTNLVDPSSFISFDNSYVSESSTPCNLKRLLIVDNCPMNRRRVVRAIQHRYGRIHQASDFSSALHKYFSLESGIQYDVIIIDSNVKNDMGPDIVRELRDKGYKGPIIGVIDVLDQESLFKSAGCDRVMMKPLDIDAFLMLHVGFDLM